MTKMPVASLDSRRSTREAGIGDRSISGWRLIPGRSKRVGVVRHPSLKELVR